MRVLALAAAAALALAASSAPDTAQAKTSMLLVTRGHYVWTCIRNFAPQFEADGYWECGWSWVRDESDTIIA